MSKFKYIIGTVEDFIGSKDDELYKYKCFMNNNVSFSNNLTPYPECWGLIAQREIITENNDSTDFLKVGSDYTLLYFTAQNVKDFEVKVIFIYNDTVLVEFNNGFLKLVSKSVLGPLQKTEKDLFIETFNNDFNGISFLPSDLYDKGYRKTS